MQPLLLRAANGESFACKILRTATELAEGCAVGSVSARRSKVMPSNCVSMMVVQKLRDTYFFPEIKHTTVLLLWSNLPFSDNHEGSSLLAGLLFPKHRLLQAVVAQPPCSRVRSVGETDLNNGRGICHSRKYLSRVLHLEMWTDKQGSPDTWQ